MDKTRGIHLTSTLPNRYKCMICGKLLDVPVQSVSCGHRFCRACVEDELVKENPKCPGDENILQKECIFPDVCAKKEISELTCYCPNEGEGCAWEGPIGTVRQHEKECAFGVVNCLYENYGCKEILQRWQLAKHLEKECAFRPHVCQYCKSTLPKEEVEEHFQVCVKYPTECPKCQQKDIPHDTLEDHFRTECPLGDVTCMFRALGCDYKCEREKLDGHIQEAVQDHLLLASRAAEDSAKQTEILSQKVTEMTEKNITLEQQVKNQNEVLVKAREALSSQQIKLGKVEKFVAEQKESFSQLAQQLDKESNSSEIKALVDGIQQQLLSHQRKIEHLEMEVQHRNARGGARGPDPGRHDHILTLLDIQLAEHDLKIQILEATTYDGQFLWKIDDFTRRFHEAATNKTPSLYSPPFYTSRFGYKVCGRIYLYGDGVGKGTHVSLFFVVMRGEYDAMLPWPFRQKVSLKLLDHDHRYDVCETFIPDTTSNSFARPKSHMNTASGCPLFCSHNLLHSHSYVKDDIMFIRIQVEAM